MTVVKGPETPGTLLVQRYDATVEILLQVPLGPAFQKTSLRASGNNTNSRLGAETKADLPLFPVDRNYLHGRYGPSGH